MKRIFIGLNSVRERKACYKVLRVDREVLISDNILGLSGFLDNIYRVRPDAVLMNLNYGFAHKKSIAPIDVVARLMSTLGYDLKKSLYGVTENADLAKEANAEGYNVLSSDFHFPIAS